MISCFAFLSMGLCPIALPKAFPIDPGNSHSRGLPPLLAIPDATPAYFRHWRQQAPVPLETFGFKILRFFII